MPPFWFMLKINPLQTHSLQTHISLNDLLERFCQREHRTCFQTTFN